MLQVYERVPSKMATIMVAFDGGARAEGNSYSMGLAHMLEHMMFKGTERRAAVEIPREIALLGGSFNAFTSFETVTYYISVPYENVEKAMDVLSDMVWNSALPEDEFQREREVVLEEEADGHSDIGSYLWETYSKNFLVERFKDPIIGTKETIKGFTRKELEKFYKKFYKRRNAIVTMCSCLSKKEGKRLLTKYFGRNSKKISHDVPMYEPEYQESREIRESRALIEHAHVWMNYPGRKLGDENEAADSIMVSILGSGMDSRLFETVREKHGLCYGISASTVSFRDQGGLIIDSSTRTQNVEKLVSLVRDEVKRLQDELVSEDELERAVNQFRSQTYMLVENSRSLASWNLKRNFFDLPGIDEVSESVRSLTREDVLESAQKYFDTSKELLMIIEPEEKV